MIFIDCIGLPKPGYNIPIKSAYIIYGGIVIGSKTARAINILVMVFVKSTFARYTIYAPLTRNTISSIVGRYTYIITRASELIERLKLNTSAVLEQLNLWWRFS